MDTCKSFIARHDRHPVHRTTSGFPNSGWLAGWRRGIVTWFRSLRLQIGQTGLGRPTSWFFGSRRWQPIPVAITARYLAPRYQTPRGKVVRI